MTVKFPIELIIWRDHSGGDRGWTPIADIEAYSDDQECLVHSVGYVIREGEKTITVISHISTETERTEMQGVMEMHILKTTVVSRETLGSISTAKKKRI